MILCISSPPPSPSHMLAALHDPAPTTLFVALFFCFDRIIIRIIIRIFRIIIRIIRWMVGWVGLVRWVDGWMDGNSLRKSLRNQWNSMRKALTSMRNQSENHSEINRNHERITRESMLDKASVVALNNYATRFVRVVLAFFLFVFVVSHV